jgi:tRNA dimethylallyltransferase
MAEGVSIIKHKVICITGPTATGKSDLGVELATLFDGEIISADSMQVYRGMDIGTAKLSKAEMKDIPHHLIDIVDPSARFTVADWSTRADSVIQSLRSSHKVPFIVGGTGLYIRSITENLDFASESGSSVVREKWRAYGDEHGKDALYNALCEVDPATAARLHPNDIRRVIRALEVYELRDTPLSSTYNWSKRGGRYETLQLATLFERQVLYERVNRRVDKMMEDGLLEEVQSLLRSGVSPDAQSMQAIGYKELVSHLQGVVDLEVAVSSIKQATRRFVKRQMSWFSRDERIIWLQRGTGPTENSVFEYAKEKVKNFLAGISNETIE